MLIGQNGGSGEEVWDGRNGGSKGISEQVRGWLLDRTGQAWNEGRISPRGFFGQ